MIVIADIHLGRENDSIMTDAGLSQTVDAMTRLDYALSIVIMRRQKVIAVAGDIFNKLNPKSSDISVWFKWLSSCRRNGVDVYMIPGNHDSGMNWGNAEMLQNAELPNVTVIQAPTMIDIDDGDNSGNVLFWPHILMSKRDELKSQGISVSEYVADMFPDTTIAITHGQVARCDYVSDVFFEAGDAMEISTKPFKKLKRIVAGHIHDHSKFGKVVYTGSLNINTFGEVDEKKGFIDLNVATGEYTWDEFPSDHVVPWVQVDLDMMDKDETSLNEADVKEIATGAVLKIVLNVKRHGVVDESYIRSMFNKYGKVTRFETVIHEGDTDVVHRKRKSHRELLRGFLKDHATSTEVEKKLALNIGSSIIEEVSE